MTLSECCGADVDQDVPICSSCKEWCDVYDDEEEGEQNGNQ